MRYELRVNGRRERDGSWSGSVILPTLVGPIELHASLPRVVLSDACRLLQEQGGINGDDAGDIISGVLPGLSPFFRTDRDVVEVGEVDPARAAAEAAKAQHEGIAVDPTTGQIGVKRDEIHKPDPLSILGNVLTGGLSGAIQTAAKGGSFGDAMGSILSGGTSSLIGSPLGGHATGAPVIDLFGGGGPLGGLLGGGGGKGGGGGLLGGLLPGLGSLLGGLTSMLPGLPGLPSPAQLLGAGPSLLGAGGLLGSALGTVNDAPGLFGSMADPIASLLRTSLRAVDSAAGSAVGDPAARDAIRAARQSTERRVAAALRMAEAALAQH